VKVFLDTSVLGVSLVDRHERLVGTLPERGAVGGTVHDAVRIECAGQAGAAGICTFAVAGFARLAPKLSDRIAAP